MLTNLHIKHYAIIDELQLDFHKGMTCLTGETGAGKSILLGALGLVLGERAESHSVKHGKDKADISAVFNIEQLTELKTQLQELDLDSENECILRRVIRSESGSKAYINGHPVTVATLKNVGNQLVNIHGQHAHQALLSKNTQRKRLDDSAQNPQVLEDVRLAFLSWQSAEQSLAELKASQDQHNERRALLDFQLDAFEQLAIVDGEWSTIQSEHQLMANSERIVSTLSNALSQLSDSDSSSAGGQTTTAVLSQHIHALESVCELDERLTPAVQALQSALIDTEEACASLRSYHNSLDLDPNRLAFLDERMGALHGLAKKHNIAPEQLYSHHQTLIAERALLDGAEHNIDELSQKLDDLAEEYKEKSNILHKLRKKTSSDISLEVTHAMQALGMEGGQFEIRVTHTPEQFSEHGQDSVEFLVSANPGQPLQPISKVASGGELSRISLAIQMITAQSEPVPTLIFDEVDAGIGGGVAEIVGKHLRSLSEQPTHTERQVLCVTHLAQVASQAHWHLKVAKEKGVSETTTNVQPLCANERVQEIARMLGGSKLSDATLAHAEDMLKDTLA